MPPGKPVTLLLIVVAQVLALALWFSGTAAGPAMARDGTLPTGFLAWLTSAVQAGFVIGTLGSATLALPDRLDPRRLIATASLVGAAANALILVLPLGHTGLLAARAAAGAALGCVGAGLLADRVGRTRVTIWAMGISGACCLLAGPAFGAHPALVVTLGLVWGVTVVADSAQFSARA
ncbi:hypothetical protein [Elioraea tepidiphila]|jgi:MFS family permease|uniref:hypothetical protein n=1 Tax=Elioraea tepidiphila TaxID=457934 RepID=UPI0003783C1D|nr:hypothetical protein [Elioraea tepidiphila]